MQQSKQQAGTVETQITMRQYCGNMPMEITKSDAWVHVSVPEMLRSTLAFHANILQLDDAYSCIKCRLQGHIYDLQTNRAFSQFSQVGMSSTAAGPSPRCLGCFEPQPRHPNRAGDTGTNPHHHCACHEACAHCQYRCNCIRHCRRTRLSTAWLS